MTAQARADWLKARQKGIGGSEVAAILGYPAFKTPVEIWMEKTGRTTESDSAMRLRYGIEAEAFIAKEYELATGRRSMRHNAQLRDDRFPYALGNIDRLVVPEGAKIAAYQGQIRTDRGLECKTVTSFYDRTEWGEAGTDNVPTGYLLQVHWYLSLCPALQVMDLAALFGAGEKLVIYSIQKDAELEEELLRRAHEWWVTHVIGDVAPEPQNEQDVLLLYPQDNTADIEATEQIIEAVAELKTLRAQLNELEVKASHKQMAIKRYMGEAATLTDADDKPLATWKQPKPTKRLNTELFKIEQPALYAKYLTEGEPTRRFLIK